MEHCHNNLERTLMLLRMHIHRYTTTVILNSDRIILIDMNGYLAAESRKSLIDRVIYHFINKVVQALLRDVTDIHRGALTNRL